MSDKIPEDEQALKQLALDEIRQCQRILDDWRDSFIPYGVVREFTRTSQRALKRLAKLNQMKQERIAR